MRMQISHIITAQLQLNRDHKLDHLSHNPTHSSEQLAHLLFLTHASIHCRIIIEDPDHLVHLGTTPLILVLLVLPEQKVILHHKHILLDQQQQFVTHLLVLQLAQFQFGVPACLRKHHQLHQLGAD